MGMRTLLAAALMLCLALPVARAAGTAGLEVEVRGGRVTVRAQKVPLNKILDRLAQQTGMKVTYRAPRRRPVTATLERFHPRRHSAAHGRPGVVFHRRERPARGTLVVSDVSGGSHLTTSSMAQDRSVPTEVVEDQPECEEPVDPQPIPSVMPELNAPPPPGMPHPTSPCRTWAPDPGSRTTSPAGSLPQPVINPFPR
jgi:hypothetical protein